MAAVRSEGLEWWATNCVRFPVARVYSGDVVDRVAFWDTIIADANGNTYPNTWAEVADQLYPAPLNNIDPQLAQAQLKYYLQTFYAEGYTGQVTLPDDTVIDVAIEPSLRSSCDITSVEVIKSCSGLTGIDNEEGYVTFANHDNVFETYFGNVQVPKRDCDGVLVDYKTLEDDSSGKSFIIDLGFKWGLESDYAEYVRQIVGTTKSRAQKTVSQGGNSLAKFRIVNNFDVMLEIPYPITQTAPLTTHLLNLFNYLDVDFEIRTDYNPSFAIDQDERVSVEKTLEQLAQVAMARVYWDGTKVIYESLEWWERNRSTPVAEINTCDHVTLLRPSTLNQTTQAVKVQQFTNPGGVESFNGESGGDTLSITNPYLDDQQMADYLSDKLFANIVNGTQQRIVETIGLPWYQIGDVIALRERIDTVYDGDKCTNIYNNGNWRICRRSELYGESGYSQKLTVDKVGIRPFVSVFSYSTNSPDITICGTVTDPASDVQVTVDGNTVTATVDQNGSWCADFTGLADDTYVISVTSTDSSNQVSTAEGTLIIFTQSPPPPTFNGDCFNQNPTFTGTFQDTSPEAPIAAVNVTVDGTTFGASLDNGDWSVNISGVADGTYTVTVTAVDIFGNDTFIDVMDVIIDSQAPVPPVINPIGTQSNPVTITGTAEPDAIVDLLLNGNIQLQTTADGTGSWTETIALPVATYSVVATQTDCAGNTSGQSDPVGLTVDPNVTLFDTASMGDQVTVCGFVSDASSIVTLLIDGNTYTPTVDISGSFCQTVTLADGVYTAVAFASDSNGIQSQDSSTVTVYTTPPPDPTIDDNCVNGSGTLTGFTIDNGDGFDIDTVVVEVVGGTTYNATLTPQQIGYVWSVTLSEPDAVTSVNIIVTDVLGNENTVNFPLTIDSTPPAAPTLDPVAPAGSVSNPITATGTAEPDAIMTFIVNGFITGILTQADGTGAFSQIFNLQPGDNTISVTATDCAGNISVPSAIQAFKVV